MIKFLSRQITDFLSKRDVIEEEKKDIYLYGYEIMISNILGFIITVLLGILFSSIWYSLIFYAVFVSVRQYTGGFHANSYLTCNIIFSLVISSVLLVSNFLTPFWNIYFTIIAFVFHMAVIILFSPLDNEHKRLSSEEKKKYRKIGIIISLVWSVAAAFLSFFWSKLTVTICVTLISISLLLLIGMLIEKGRCNHEI